MDINNANFNLIPWDTEAYLIAADYAEEQGFLIPNAIRNKVLPLDREKCSDGNSFGDGSSSGRGGGEYNGYGWGYSGGYYNYSGDGYGFSQYHCLGSGNGLGDGFGQGSGHNYT